MAFDISMIANIPGPGARPSYRSLIYTRPDLIPLLYDDEGDTQGQFPGMPGFITPKNNFMDDYTEMRLQTALSESLQSSRDILKAGIFEFAGSALMRSPQNLQGLSLPSRFRAMVTQAGTDIYEYLGRAEKGVPFARSFREAAATPPIKPGEVNKVFRPSKGRPSIFQKRGVFSRALPFIIPTKTGMTSMLFWNMASGNFDENLGSSYSSLFWNIGKYAAMAKVVGLGAKLLKPVLGEAMTGGVSVRDPTKLGLSIQRGTMRDISLFERQTKRAGVTGSNRLKTFLGLGTARDATKTLGISSMKWAGAAGKTFGYAIRAINIVGGISAAVDIGQSFIDYRNSIRQQFQRNAMNYETAFSYIPELPEAATDRQRHIQAIQSSSLSIRNLIGNEATLMHKL